MLLACGGNALSPRGGSCNALGAGGVPYAGMCSPGMPPAGMAGADWHHQQPYGGMYPHLAAAQQQQPQVTPLPPMQTAGMFGSPPAQAPAQMQAARHAVSLMGNSPQGGGSIGKPAVAIPRSLLQRIDGIVSSMEQDVMHTLEGLGGDGLLDGQWAKQYAPIERQRQEANRLGRLDKANLAKLRQLVAATKNPLTSTTVSVARSPSPRRLDHSDLDYDGDSVDEESEVSDIQTRSGYSRHLGMRADANYRVNRYLHDQQDQLSTPSWGEGERADFHPSASSRAGPRSGRNAANKNGFVDDPQNQRRPRRKADEDPPSLASDLEADSEFGARMRDSLRQEGVQPHDHASDDNVVDDDEAGEDDGIAARRRSDPGPSNGSPRSKRLVELEAELAAAKADREARVQQLEAKMVDLERQLSVARTAEESHEKLRTAYRARIGELEKEVEDTRAAEEGRCSHSATLRARILELEQELATSHASNDSQNRQLRQRVQDLEMELSSKDMRIKELEQDVTHFKATAEMQGKHQSAHAARHEQELAALTTENERHARQHAHHVERISALEQELHHTKLGQEQHAKRATMNQERLEQLTVDLHDSRAGQERHLKAFNTQAARAAQLEQELHEANEAARRKERSLQRQVHDLEQEIHEEREKNEQHAKQQHKHRNRVMQLEEELSRKDSEVQARHTLHRRNSNELERALASAEEAGEEVNALKKKSAEDAKRIQQLEHALAEAQHLADDSRRQIERQARRSLETSPNVHVSDVQRELSEAHEVQAPQRTSLQSGSAAVAAAEQVAQRGPVNEEYLREEQRAAVEEHHEAVRVRKQVSHVEFRLEDEAVPHRTEGNSLQAPIRELVSRYRSESSFRSSDDGSDDHVRRQASRPVQAEFSITRHFTREMMPGVRDPFLTDCREALSNVDQAMQKALDVQVAILDAQFRCALGAGLGNEASGPDLRAASGRCDLGQFVAERQAAVAALQEQVAEVEGLLEEAGMQCHMASDERKQAVQRLELTLHLIANQQALLKADPLMDIPDALLSSLVDTAAGEELRPVGEGVGCAHWAAQNGRTDILEYLVQKKDNSVVFEAYDKHGRSPLYYAKNFDFLTPWLRQKEKPGSKAPVHSKTTHAALRTKALAPLQAPQLKLLEEVEMHGWEAASWPDSKYTFLHWAAEEGNVELCRYLVENLGADTSVMDSYERTAQECAKEAGHQAVVKLFQQLQQERPIVAKGRSLNLAGHSRIMDLLNARAADKPSPRREHRRTLQDFSDGLPSFFRKDSDASSVGGGSSSGGESAASQVSEQVEDPGIPLAYIKVIEQIDEVGWDNMEWAKGYTLLHWAAKNNMPALCVKFLHKGADPHQRDLMGKDSFDYARESGAEKVLDLLRRGPPEEEPRFAMFTPSTRSRASVPVHGQIRTSEIEEVEDFMQFDEDDDGPGVKATE